LAYQGLKVLLALLALLEHLGLRAPLDPPDQEDQVAHLERTVNPDIQASPGNPVHPVLKAIQFEDPQATQEHLANPVCQVNQANLDLPAMTDSPAALASQVVQALLAIPEDRALQESALQPLLVLRCKFLLLHLATLRLPRASPNLPLSLLPLRLPLKSL